MPYNDCNRELKERLSSLRITYRDLAEACNLPISFVNSMLLVPMTEESHKIVENGIEKILANPNRKRHWYVSAYPKTNLELRKKLKTHDILMKDLARKCYLTPNSLSVMLTQELKPHQLERYEKAIAQILEDRKNNSQGR